MYITLVIIVIIAMIHCSMGQIALPPPTASDFQSACAKFNTSFTCSRSIGVICLWDSTMNMCNFHSNSCPSDLGQSLISISNCGATMNNSCPTSCVNPQIQFIVRLHIDAGLKTFTDQPTMLMMAQNNTQVAQTIANVQFCTTTLTSMQYTNMVMEACNVSTAQYNAAIMAGQVSNGGSSSGETNNGSTSTMSAVDAVGPTTLIAVITMIFGAMMIN